MSDIRNKVPIAIVCNSVPPYRMHLHRRIAREMTEIQLITVCTHDEPLHWSATDLSEIGFVSMSSGIGCEEQGALRSIRREWELGGRLIRWIRKSGIRAVILCGYNDAARLRVLFWCRSHGVPCLLSADSNIETRRKHSWLKEQIKRVVLGMLLHWFDLALPFGTAGIAYFRNFGVPRNRMFRFPLEPDYSIISQLPQETISQTRDQFGLKADKRRILYCGRLIPLKRVDMLLDVFAAIAGRRPAWDLVILGDGPSRNDLESRVPAELRARVLWLGKTSDQRLVSAIQRSCEVLVLPSRQEAWGLVINEALASGMAVVCSSAAGASFDLVRDGINGRIFPLEIPAALEECLLDVTDESRLATMQAQSVHVLADWRRRADPVEGLRGALKRVWNQKP